MDVFRVASLCTHHGFLFPSIQLHEYRPNNAACHHVCMPRTRFVCRRRTQKKQNLHSSKRRTGQGRNRSSFLFLHLPNLQLHREAVVVGTKCGYCKCATAPPVCGVPYARTFPNARDVRGRLWPAARAICDSRPESRFNNATRSLSVSDRPGSAIFSTSIRE